MFLIAFRNLFQEKGRLIVSISGVAFSVLLIIVLEGLYQGWSFKMGEYIRAVPADFWVEQTGGKDMFHSISIMPASAQSVVDGVASLKPFIGRRVAFDSNGREIILYLVGFDEKTGAGPVRVVKGSATAKKGEIIIDRKVSESNKLSIGDKLKLGDESFTIAGISEGGDVVTLSYAFINADEAREIFELPEKINYMIVTVKNGFDKQVVMNKVEKAVPGVKSVSREDFANDNTEIIRDTFLPIIYILVIIGAVVGLTFIGLTTFTSTIEKAKEYGVLKAIGVRNSQLFRIVLEQSLLSGVIGFVFGVGLAFLVSNIAGRFVSEFVSLIRPFDILWVFGLSIGMSILATYIPTRRISRIDPAEVFKA